MIEHCDVAIVGAGPAGLAAAVELKRRGVAGVVVIERDGQPGGVPRHCGHPPFGFREFGRMLTGPRYAARLAALAEAAGAEIRLRRTVTALGSGGHLQIASPGGHEELLANRVILATGARETPRSARLISGTRPLGIINTGALQAYVHLNGLAPFRRPVVVGTELVSLSALATCRSHGIQPIAMIEANPAPVARWPFTLFPKLIGVPLHLHSDVTEIIGRTRVEAVRITDRQTGHEQTIECDGVLLTGQFVPEASLVRAGALELDPGSNGPVIDQDGRCSDPVYFAAGNLLRPIETAGWSYREGRRVAEIVAADLAHPAPAPIHHVTIQAGDGIRYVVPQRIALREGPETQPQLQLRASRPVEGQLVLRAGERALASRRITSRPERRIILPASDISVTEDMDVLTAEVRE